MGTGGAVMVLLFRPLSRALDAWPVCVGCVVPLIPFVRSSLLPVGLAEPVCAVFHREYSLILPKLSY
jgi:hypothetical protein